MFQNLAERLQSALGKLTGRGRLREEDVDAAMREVRLALLEADVNFGVVKDFVARVRERSVGQEVAASLTPGQTVVKIVVEELTALMGGTASDLVLTGRVPAVVMLVGLQGSGKTTAAAKLAALLRGRGRHPLLVACDVHRPAAIHQLETLGSEIDIPVFVQDSSDPVQIATDGVKQAVAMMKDTVILDTAGRLHIDEGMMREAVAIRDAVRPDQILLVVDSMTGQDAVNVAGTFAERLDFDGVVLTKLDGDARGGAALSVKAVTGKPVKFASVGERPDSIEVFHPDRMAKRILGMGDVVGLIEKAEQAVDAEAASGLERAITGAEFTLDDFLSQLQQVRKMGSLRDIVSMLPGAPGKALRDVPIDEKALDRVAAIVRSMTPSERRKPSIINGSRRQRIAAGAGVAVFDVNQLLKQFAQVQKMMRQFGKATGKGRRGKGIPGMRLPF